MPVEHHPAVIDPTEIIPPPLVVSGALAPYVRPSYWPPLNSPLADSGMTWRPVHPAELPLIRARIAHGRLPWWRRLTVRRPR